MPNAGNANLSISRFEDIDWDSSRASLFVEEHNAEKLVSRLEENIGVEEKEKPCIDDKRGALGVNAAMHGTKKIAANRIEGRHGWRRSHFWE